MRTPLLFRFFQIGLIGSALFAAVATAPHAQAQFAWRLVKHDGRDYLPLGNVAEFYQLQLNPRTASNPVTTLSGPRARIELAGNGRELIVNGVKQCLSFPLVMQNEQIFLSRFDLAKTVDPVLRPNAISELRPFKTVVLDAGHGGQDRGANSATGFEKDYTLDVIRDLRRLLLAKGFQVKMTREDDVFIPLEGRAEAANAESDAIFVSVHFNSAADGVANGFEVFSMTPRGALSTGDTVPTLDALKELPGNACDNASLALATCVQHSLLGHIPQADRGVKRARFVVLKQNRLPAVLVEGGFLTSPTESQRINEAAWRQKLAESIVAGVESYRQVAERKAMPRLLADYRLEQLPLAARMVDPNAVAATVPNPGVLPTNNPTVDAAAPPPPIAAPPPAPPAPASALPPGGSNGGKPDPGATTAAPAPGPTPVI